MAVPASSDTVLMRTLSDASRSRLLDAAVLGPRPSTRDAPPVGRFGNSHMRFTTAFALLVLAIATSPMWVWLLAGSPMAGIRTGAVVLGIVSIFWLWIAANAVRNFVRMGSMTRVPINGITAARARRFRHVVVVPCYKDPLDVLLKCIGSLCLQADPRSLIVVLAMEARAPDAAAKVAAVRRVFASRFSHLLVSLHELEPETEIPGGCSNKNCALRNAYDYVVRTYGDVEQRRGLAVTITTCDTDSLFHPDYFRVLENAYNATNPDASAPPRMLVWQPPLFYNWKLDERPFFNRITGLVRSMMMLGGLISFDLNPMSIFSYPLELSVAAGFINPRYSVDDIIFKVRCMCDTNSAVPVELLPVPVISGPTIGESFCEEVVEWSRQLRRWIVGAAESFHYFITHWKGRPLLGGLRWLFTFFMYYAVLLCAGSVLAIFASLLPLLSGPADLPVPSASPADALRLLQSATTTAQTLDALALLAPLLALGAQFVCFAVAFGIDRAAVRTMGVQERMHPLRNLLHWLVSPLSLATYSVIAFLAILEFVFVGKAMAGHRMAAKAGFSDPSSPTSVTPAVHPVHPHDAEQHHDGAAADAGTPRSAATTTGGSSPAPGPTSSSPSAPSLFSTRRNSRTTPLMDATDMRPFDGSMTKVVVDDAYVDLLLVQAMPPHFAFGAYTAPVSLPREQRDPEAGEPALSQERGGRPLGRDGARGAGGVLEADV